MVMVSWSTMLNGDLYFEVLLGISTPAKSDSASEMPSEKYALLLKIFRCINSCEIKNEYGLLDERPLSTLSGVSVLFARLEIPWDTPKKRHP